MEENPLTEMIQDLDLISRDVKNLSTSLQNFSTSVEDFSSKLSKMESLVKTNRPSKTRGDYPFESWKDFFDTFYDSVSFGIYYPKFDKISQESGDLFFIQKLLEQDLDHKKGLQMFIEFLVSINTLQPGYDDDFALKALELFRPYGPPNLAPIFEMPYDVIDDINIYLTRGKLIDLIAKVWSDLSSVFDESKWKNVESIEDYDHLQQDGKRPIPGILKNRSKFLSSLT